ncbi:MAG: hypothetical protein IAE89_11530 [Anaerolineae bacterium]|nr:hypothetical protein [Anaerolineae bacterium]
MTVTKTKLSYLEWIALADLYKGREKPSSPARYVGLPATIASLIKRQPPLAAWVGKASENLVHITPEGIAFYENGEGDS